jgi:hypothetical protein
MSAQMTIQRVTIQGSAQRSPASQIERLDRLIREAETRLAEQEAYVLEASLANSNTAVATFELQKMHLLIALLREGRERLSDGSCG